MLRLFQVGPSAFEHQVGLSRTDADQALHITFTLFRSSCRNHHSPLASVWGAQCRLESSWNPAPALLHMLTRCLVFLCLLFLPYHLNIFATELFRNCFLLWIFTVLSTRGLWSTPGTQDVAPNTQSGIKRVCTRWDDRVNWSDKRLLSH